MATITFDTHAFIKRLKESGLSEAQAEVITQLQQEAVTTSLEQARQTFHLDELALKHDVKEIDLKIETLRADLRRELAESKAELIRWVVSAGILQTAIIGALLLSLVKS
jgi:hypothetical protein